ncbi:hypothetical protein BC941DRAFT_95479 [Chlamydoabsidia padenii]|nr:hypothetical protein BC941DRAFT_95479 [Chlamydoabsidia padenii]
MPAISSIKESFALAGADITAREKVVSHSTVAGTEDWYYYHGLTLLQKLSAALNFSSADSTNRPPTEQETELLKEMDQLLKNYKDQFFLSARYTELESRFYLLTWFINGDKSKKFIQDSLSLNLPLAEHQHSSTTVDLPINDQVTTAHDVSDTKKSYPTSLDATFLNNDKVMRGLMDTDELHQLKETAWPTVQQFWSKLDSEQQTKVLERLLWKPVTNDAVPIVSYLVNLWRPFETQRRDVLADKVARLPLHNLTLDQMKELSTLLPAILQVNGFVTNYMEKLVPDAYVQDVDGQKSLQVWDGDDKWDSYLAELDRFADRLMDGPFRLIKARITFQRLRSTLLRGELDQDLLLGYFSQSRVKKNDDVTSPLPSQSTLFGRYPQDSDIKIPLLGKCKVSAQEEKEVIEEYLAGLIRAQKLNSLQPFGAYLDQKSFLEPLHAKVMLTSGLVENDNIRSWSKVLGNAAYGELVKQTILTFGLATLHKTNNRLTKDDCIKTHVIIKNVPQLTMRIFPIDLYNYWKLHPHDTTIKDGNKLNVDGLCPVYEHHVDYSTRPALQRIEETFVFGGPQYEKAINPVVFTGRGAWMIDFIGGQDQCRAIIQKGYLRHVMQKSAAGHLLLILDEYNNPLKDATVWLENESYAADDTGNILIPYRSKDGKDVRALLVTPDGYCQPLEFYHEEESYSLEASFYINYESLIPNKRTKVIITPALKIHDQTLSLKLLDNIALEVVTTNTNDVKSSTTFRKLTMTHGNVIECGFSVPSSLESIKLTLSAKVKTMSQDEPWKQLECTREIRCATTEQDEITATQLRVDASGYLLHVIGKNGEPHKDHALALSFKHTLTHKSIDITMQSDNNGYITLGTLDNVESISINKPWKTWDLLGDNWKSVGKKDEAALPLNIQYSANTEFKIPFTMSEGCNCTLFQTGVRRMPVVDYTKRLQYTGSTVTVVNGLPEGSYCFYLSRPYQRYDSLIEITIVNNKANHVNIKFWNNWMIGDRIHGESTGDVIKKPLEIEQVETTDKSLTLKLKNGTTSSRPPIAVITTSSFVPALTDSLSATQLKNAQTRRLSYGTMAQGGLEHIYLTGRKLGEEYQYILNRSKQDMYVGSTITEPSILVNPKKNGSTTVKTRITGQGNQGFTGETTQTRSAEAYHSLQTRCLHRMTNGSDYSDMNFAFLDQKNHVMILKPNEDGEFVVDRSQLGDGNLVQVVIMSGDQAVSRTLVLSDVDIVLKLNDQRQTDQNLDINAAYLRNKVITTLSPSHPLTSVEMDPTQHEFELVDSQDKLLDLYKLLAPNHANDLKDFDILRQWTTWTNEEKIKAHGKINTHELNLWIKNKDVDFFEVNIKPFIKSKINKTFMDYYLIDADLTKYANSLHLFQQLTVPEKALLARRVPSVLPVVLESFKANHEPSLSDQPFDTVLAGSLLNAPVMKSMDFVQACAAPAPSSSGIVGRMHSEVSFGSASGIQRHAKRAFAPMAMANFSHDNVSDSMDIDDNAESSEDDQGVQEDYDFGDDTYSDQNDDDDDDSLMVLREQSAKRRRLQKPYNYMEPTSEWAEKEYYSDKSELIKVNKFWIDYLENKIDIFVSGNVIYATTNITEMIFALALTDLPMKHACSYEKAVDSTSGHINITADSPLMIFYRSLKKCDESPVANPTLLLGQHLFEQNKNTDNAADDQHIVDPNQLMVRTPYGWHLAVSNISTKTAICELTLQIPTGAVPLGDTPYCQSKSIMIQPYTTWHEVVGSFYFPVHGTFHQFAVTVGEQQKTQLETTSNKSTPTMILVNQTQPLALTVTEPDEHKQYQANNTPLSDYASWSVVNSTGTAKDVLTYVENNGGKLNTLDWSLVAWRMTNQSFARSLLTILTTHKHYESSLYAYGVYHGFVDIITDLLLQERSMLLERTGVVFDSPLVKWRSSGQEYPKVLDYYPMANARVHSLGSSNEIDNQEFYQQYDRFLDYLNQLLDRKSNDYIILSIYLILQGRIGEAHQTYQLSQQVITQEDDDTNNDVAAIQRDYLGAYLATRVKVGNTLDISTVKQIVDKYKSCGSLRWRNLFGELNDFVAQVENGDDQQNINADSLPTKENKSAIGTDPVFDFTIKDNKVVIRYANVTQLQVRFYNINAEVMFSNQPFLNNTNKMSNYGWVKANHVEKIDLINQPSHDDVTLVDQDDDMEWIGVNKIRPHRHSVPVPLLGNMLVEVHAHGKTQCQTHFNHALTVHVSEQYGIARVLAPVNSSDTNQPLSGVYVKVYAKLDNGRTEFWKDGYTSLTGIFDYISVTHGNALVGASDDGGLEQVVKKIQKLSLLFSSAQHGVVVKEACPPI